MAETTACFPLAACMAQLFPSVPPEVKNTSFWSQPSMRATACRESRCTFLACPAAE